MTSKQKVLKIRPNAYLTEINGYQILAGIQPDGIVQLSHKQSRESWAWAEALRTLKR